MNPKFILPVSFALTAHVFLLFGLPGRAPVDVGTPEDKPLPLANLPRLLLDEPIRAAPDDEHPPVNANGGNNLAPRPDDVVPPDAELKPFVIPPLPRVDSGGPTTRIDPNWSEHRGPETSTGTAPTDWRKLDHVPRARTRPPPVYPRDMRDLGIEGNVVVDFWVDEAGEAHDPTVVSATRREFEEAAVRAVARWKFEPGYVNGRRVRFRMSVPLVFKLEPD